jgi:hypothetical protein
MKSFREGWLGRTAVEWPERFRESVHEHGDYIHYLRNAPPKVAKAV